MEIPLKRKYRVHKPVKQTKSHHDDGHKRRAGYSKHKGQKPPYTNHVVYVMVLQVNGKRRFMPAHEYDPERFEADG